MIAGKVNNGGDLVERNFKTIDSKILFKAVHASRGKAIRAEPISELYEQGKVHHFGTFPQLEDQMCEWVLGVEKSPDRIDTLVWTVTKLTKRSSQNVNINLTKSIHTVPRNSINMRLERQILSVNLSVNFRIC